MRGNPSQATLQADGSGTMDHKSEIEVARSVGCDGSVDPDIGVVDLWVGSVIARTEEHQARKFAGSLVGSVAHRDGAAFRWDIKFAVGKNRAEAGQETGRGSCIAGFQGPEQGSGRLVVCIDAEAVGVGLDRNNHGARRSDEWRTVVNKDLS